MKNLLALFYLVPIFSFGQTLSTNGSDGGIFSLGFRTTFSTFNGAHDEGNGLGAGGQFRLQLADRVNTDWFFDYIRTDVGDYANRIDYHIGWSVLYYILEDREVKVKPYILAGHCFDYTHISDNRDVNNFDERWSSAVQGGMGVHFNLSPRVDISLTTQYMLHLGNEVEVDYHMGEVEFHESHGGSAEGHLLINISLNYKLADLW